MGTAAQLPVQLKNQSVFETRGLIAGQWKDGHTTFPVSEPSTGGVLAQCANFQQPDFVEAIESAHVAFKEYYSSTTAKDRQALLRRWNDLILENADDCEKSELLAWIEKGLITSFYSGNHSVPRKWEANCRS